MSTDTRGLPRSAVDLSVVVPAYNEEAAIEPCLAALSEQLARVGLRFELIVVDDGSRDRTADVLARVAEADSHVRVVSLARNFGKEAALAAGLGVARGRAVLTVDADLQHPADLIPRMIELWRKGYDVVNGVKQERGEESLVYRVMTRAFNWLMGSAAGANFHGASDYKLMDRQVVDALIEFPEHNRFFRGLVAWVGFRVAEIPFAVGQRVAGASKWSVSGLIRYSLRNLVAFSPFPLRVVAAAGFFTLVFAFGLAIWTLFRYLNGTALTGVTTVILLQLILDGLVLTSLGV
ncbi:MAG TPA: glycosyltransferase family 2 protein, partial [Candidatus Limnocylindria bacterium]|nr:glycosyltransferase family 2 protein [Candidatus Limnocylindria bacterium]